MNKRFWLALFCAAFFGILAVFVARQYLIKIAERETVTAVIAATDIPAGAVITASQLETHRFNKADRIARETFSKPEAVVGRVTSKAVSAYAPILVSQLAPQGTSPDLSFSLPPGQLAVALRVDETSIAAGFTRPGTRVDVVSIIQARTGPVSKVILPKVLVLPGRKQPGSGGESAPGSLVTLQVSPKEALKLKLAESIGRLQLVLRNSADESFSPTPDVTVADLIRDQDSPRRNRPATPEKEKPAVRPTLSPVPAPTPDSVTVVRGSRREVVQFLVRP
ncbi:MAG TPA: Flp pilus assembly protein CpaB [Blastocatellia bacterium]|nr:Flp pilus assembly protein CpaB [Blastocatellia bacterium]